jgi:hypothetical protein
MHAEPSIPSPPPPEKSASSAPARETSSPPVRSLDALLDLSPKALERLYAGARVPDLSAIRGDLKGRMLAWAELPERVNRLLLRWARSDGFPWRGKTFSPHGAARGEGINRVFLDRWKVFRFETSIGPSRSGAFDAVQLDYDLPTNPPMIRAIKDEIRALAPGLYLGQAYLVLRGKPRLVLYFGLEE